MSGNRVKVDASMRLVLILGTMSSTRSLHWLMVRQKVGSEPNRKQNQSPFGHTSGTHGCTAQSTGELSICNKNTGRTIQKVLVKGAFPGCWNNGEVMWKNILIYSLAMQDSDLMNRKVRIPLILHMWLLKLFSGQIHFTHHFCVLPLCLKPPCFFTIQFLICAKARESWVFMHRYLLLGSGENGRC